MNVEFTQNFMKIFKKRFSHQSQIQQKFFDRTRQFSKNPKDSLLKNHSLKGKKIGLHAFSITGDIRVVYYVKNDTAYFIDIGTHNQVY